jgi:glutamine amidotransferase
MIVIVDYGMGNIHSVQKALEGLGGVCQVTNQTDKIKAAEKLVLPGVGAFSDAMAELEKQGLIPDLKMQIKNGKPFLGICLGMQLLFEESEEAQGIKGLGIIKGVVKRFDQRLGLKVPHMGWNNLNFKKQNFPLLRNLADKPYVYFCHSYYPAPSETGVIVATTDYGIEFASLIAKDNVYGVQFHPEKSQKTGLKIIENFINLC